MFHAAAPRLRCDRQTALRRGEIRLQGGDGRLRRRDPGPGTIGQCKILIEPEALLPQERLNPGDLGTHPSLILNYRRVGPVLPRPPRRGLLPGPPPGPAPPAPPTRAA